MAVINAIRTVFSSQRRKCESTLLCVPGSGIELVRICVKFCVVRCAGRNVVPETELSRLNAAEMTNQKVAISYQGGIVKDDKGTETYNYHNSAKSVIAPHNFSYVVIQACVAILILVGFESVTAMGEEARNAKRDIPRAVLLSLLIQGGFCYALEYFAGNYFLHSSYQATANASSSSAPVSVWPGK